ncbi:MAG: endonuclease/exonuclease/phosphatase family protein [Propionibacteriaceae bacterium]|jgi:endonuclease/exonuclease/phosphatase (EEP) superfamily protein YafD|nr:endonuclease/exonuclease/phosphatase family protein [Propionibacteriaceae bacterium]
MPEQVRHDVVGARDDVVAVGHDGGWGRGILDDVGSTVRRRKPGPKRHSVWLATAWIAVAVGFVPLASAMLPSLQALHRVIALAATFAPHAVFAWLYATLVLVIAAHRKGKLLALIAALGLVVNVLTVSHYLPHAAPEGKASIRVFSSNLFYGQADIAALAEQLDTAKPDVVVFTEITKRDYPAIEEALQKTLPYHAGYPAEAYSVAGAAIFSKYPLDIIDTTESAAYECFAVAVSDPDGRFVLAGVHASSPVYGTDRWLTDASAISAMAGRQMGGPLVVAGDFNATLEHLSLRRILAAGLTDAADESGTGWLPTWPTLDWPAPLIGIDHVLTNRYLAAKSVYAVNIKGTDHAAVVADLIRV